MASVFAKDNIDHCVIGTIRISKLPEHKPRIITKRDTKHFSEQAFLHNLFYSDWGKIDLIADADIV